MGILLVHELSGSRASADDAFRREYTRRFRVVTNSTLVGANEVRFALGIPRIWDSYVTETEFDLAALCRKVTPSQDEDDPQEWTVEVEYSTTVREEGQQADNPLDEPAEIIWTTESYDQAIETDVDGNSITNSAYDAFDPPPTARRSKLKLTIVRNELTYDPGMALTYMNTLNSGSFFGAEAGTVLLSDWSGRRAHRSGIVYWINTYVFEFDLDGWAYEPLDQGFREFDIENDPDFWTPIMDGGRVVQQPVLLDGEGLQLAPGEEPFFHYYEIYPEEDFSALLLP